MSAPECSENQCIRNTNFRSNQTASLLHFRALVSGGFRNRVCRFRDAGTTLSDYLAGIHPEDVQRIADAINCTIVTREKYVQEYRLLQKDGNIRWVEARGECLYSEDGKPDRFVGVVVDITSQKNAQERQRLLAREADHRVKTSSPISAQ